MDQGEGFSCQRKDFLDTMTSYVISYVQSERSDPIFLNRKLIGRGNHFPRAKVPLLAKVPQGSEGNYSQLRFFLCTSVMTFKQTFFLPSHETEIAFFALKVFYLNFKQHVFFQFSAVKLNPYS